VHLRPAKTSAVISPGTSDKVNDLQVLDNPDVQHLNVSANKKESKEDRNPGGRVA
jgi:hypothetical protein